MGGTTDEVNVVVRRGVPPAASPELSSLCHVYIDHGITPTETLPDLDCGCRRRKIVVTIH